MHTLVGISLGVMSCLVDLVADGILSSCEAGPDACVVVLGNLFVGFLGSLSSTSFDGLGGVVGGVL